jgi:3D (Asp-Asp-Asp) domain-containing protein
MNRLLAITVMLGMLPPATQAKVRTIDAVVTAYCPCRLCCGPRAQGITSTGQDARTSGCAVDPRHISYGSRVRIPGIGWRTADDTGSAMREDGEKGIIHIDVRMQSHEQALRFGVRRTTIRIDDASRDS